jgi:hypothetical protein
MDLDKILGALRDATGQPAADAPLITTDSFVPEDSDALQADADASRRMLAAFAYWLVAYDRIAADAPSERVAILSSIASRPEESAKAVGELGDRLLPSDVHAEWKGFATGYLAPVEASLGDDYFKMFVEEPGRRSMRDAHPTRSDYERLARQIEGRARRFREGSPDWRQPAEARDAPEPALWKGGTKDEWLRRIATYEDLEDSLPKLRRARIEEYWSLVDAAPSMPEPEVASALVRTYLWVGDSDYQEAVYGSLKALPPAVALQGILENIVEIESKTTCADTVVDVFPKDLDEAELRRLAGVIRTAPHDEQAAYTRALARVAEEGGSPLAARLLRLLGA